MALSKIVPTSPYSILVIIKSKIYRKTRLTARVMHPNCCSAITWWLLSIRYKYLSRHSKPHLTHFLNFPDSFMTSIANYLQVPLSNMTGMRVLNVSHNLIRTVPRQTFPKLYELHTIDLSYNNLTEIHNGIFQSLFSLRVLNFSHNSLDKIKPSTFGPLPTLLELDLSYNNLNEISRGSLTRLASCQ